MTRDRDLDPESLRAARSFLLDRTERRQAKDEGDKQLAAMLEEQRRRLDGITAEPEAPEPAPEARRVELTADRIRRVKGGWRASCRHRRGVDARFVSDERYGGYLRSFIEAIDVRDRFHRDRRVALPTEIAAIVEGERVAPDFERADEDHVVVRFRGEEHEVEGDDALEIAIEIALDLFVEYLWTLPEAQEAAPPPPAATTADVS